MFLCSTQAAHFFLTIKTPVTWVLATTLNTVPYVLLQTFHSSSQALLWVPPLNEGACAHKGILTEMPALWNALSRKACQASTLLPFQLSARKQLLHFYMGWTLLCWTLVLLIIMVWLPASEGILAVIPPPPVLPLDSLSLALLYSDA